MCRRAFRINKTGKGAWRFHSLSAFSHLIQKGQECRLFQQFWKVNDMADMVKVEHLKKNFGDLEVLKDINLTVKEGEKLVIIGPSGSGKSTFIRCINHLEDPTSGTISIAGTPVTKKNYLDMAKKYSSMVRPLWHLQPLPHQA